MACVVSRTPIYSLFLLKPGLVYVSCLEDTCLETGRQLIVAPLAAVEIGEPHLVRARDLAEFLRTRACVRRSRVDHAQQDQDKR